MHEGFGFRTGWWDEDGLDGVVLKRARVFRRYRMIHKGKDGRTEEVSLVSIHARE